MTARKFRLVLSLAMPLTLLTGCGLFEKADPRIAAERSTADTSTVTLIEEGAEPRRPVTFSFVPGTSADLVFSIDMHLTQRTSDDESPQVIDPPVTHQSVHLTVEGVDAAGATVRFEVTDAGIDPTDTLLTDVQILELTAALQSVVGLQGSMRIGQRGEVLSVTYEDSASLASEVTEQLQSIDRGLASLVPVLPTEPIGRGARWRTVTHSEGAGVRLRQTTEYEVTAIDDGRLTYRATISQSAPEQDLSDVDAGARLLAADIAGSTTGMVSTTGLESESETTLSGRQVIDQGLGGASQHDVTQELDLLITVAPAAGTNTTGP